MFSKQAIQIAEYYKDNSLGLVQKSIYNIIKKETTFLGKKIQAQQRIWHIINNTKDIPMCKTCRNNVKWNNQHKKYRDYCSQKCASSSSETRQKVQKTCIRKFGVDNAFKSEEKKQKIKETNIQKYGVTSYTKTNEYNDKTKKTYLEKYGVPHHTKTEEYRNKCRETSLKNIGYSHHSQIGVDKDIIVKREDIELLKHLHHTEKKTIAQISKELGYTNGTTIWKLFRKHNIEVRYYNHSMAEQEIVDFIKTIYDGEIIQGCRSILKKKEIDIYLPEKNLAFEFDGIYWHSEKQGKGRHYHKNKSVECANQGIRLIHIFENEWLCKRDIVESRIGNMLGLSQRIFARKCKVIELSNDQMRKFFNKTHIQGYQHGKYGYGLVYKRPKDGRPWLVAALNFSKPRYTKKYEYELIRYSNALGTSVVGGASKLFKHFTRTHNPKSIITYTDLRWNIGVLYEKLGFTKKNIAEPNYFYFTPNDITTLHSRVQFQKHKLEKKLKIFDANKTEYENMVINGWDRIWDCGNAVFEIKC